MRSPWGYMFRLLFNDT